MQDLNGENLIIFVFNIFRGEYVDFNILFWDSLLVKEMEISPSGIYPRHMQISWNLSGTNSELYIEIPLFCPRCESDRIWKIGKDPTRKTKPQKIYCADCGKRFYPHTSKFFQDQTEDLLTDLIEAALGRGHKITDLATRYNISPSVISTILTDFLDYMAEIKDKARSYHDIHPGKVILMDEKFLKIGGKTYKLIIALNEHGDPLTYLLAKDRAATTILGVLLEAIQVGGHPDLIVTDGFSGYRKAIKLAGLSIIHIEHIHKPPYGRVIITKIEQTKTEIKETSIGTTNDIFVQNGINIGRVLVKETKKDPTKKNEGDPKAQKIRKSPRKSPTPQKRSAGQKMYLKMGRHTYSK